MITVDKIIKIEELIARTYLSLANDESTNDLEFYEIHKHQLKRLIRMEKMYIEKYREINEEKDEEETDSLIEQE